MGSHAEAFHDRRRSDLTVVMDAGTLSEANTREIDAAGLGSASAIGPAMSSYVTDESSKRDPESEVPDGVASTQPRPDGAKRTRRDQVTYYRYRAYRLRRSLRGIEEQVGRAEKVAAGKGTR